MTSNEL
jgi:hypothetical protein